MLVRHYPTLMPGSAICSGYLLSTVLVMYTLVRRWL
jgi:hypothetical protein